MKIPFREQLEHLLVAGYQAFYIPTVERERCEAEIIALAEDLGMDVVTWDGVDGFSEKPEIKDPVDALLSLDRQDIGKAEFKEDEVLFIFRNLHPYLEDPNVRQAFQNMYYDSRFNNPDYRHPIIILSPVLQIHEEIAPCVTVVNFDLPNEEELIDVFDKIEEGVTPDDSRPGEASTTYTPELKADIIQAMRGLTTAEAGNVLAYGLRVNRGFKQEIVDTLENQKANILKKAQVLTYIPKDLITTMSNIGGYEELKRFIGVRRLAYTRAARELGLDLPRGIVLLGIPGTGKSMVGKIIARELSLPLVVLNVASVFGSLVGESERRITSALNTVDAMDGAVMLVDEAEKALGGAVTAAGDSGVSQRVFGVLLTWLTEKKSRTFVVMTMNRTLGIPPEFLRKGRFDEIFYTELPPPEERDEILKIHCRIRDVDVDQYPADDWNKLILNTDKFVGSELEQIVCDARFEAFASRQTGQPTIEELVEAAKLVMPVAETEKDVIKNMMEVCKGKARPVSRRSKNRVGKAKTRQITV